MYSKKFEMEPQVPHWSPKVPTNAKHTKNSPKLQKKHTRRWPKQPNKEEKPYTHNQPIKERKRDTKKQTIEQTHTHAHELRTANTNSNSRGRVLAEGDVDPAAGSPKEPFRL